MKIEFDTKREEEIFKEFLKAVEMPEMRTEVIVEARQLIQKIYRKLSIYKLLIHINEVE